MRSTRLVKLIALLLLPGALMAAAPGTDTAPQAAAPKDPLVGDLLVAAPGMSDPRFVGTVILMVRHDKTGALGIVINHLVEKRTIASLLAAMGKPDASVHGTLPVFVGGPVEPTIGFVVHSAEYHRADTIPIDGHVAVTSNPAVLRDIGHGAGPAKYLLAFGYAGWGPGQLEAELAQHAWFTEPEDPKLVFDDDRDIVWKEALARRSRNL
ncbi:MAG TPA: YqgE/AlgH family protein [Stellaceae bacterium]|nr:YqgE/AlgH family protein [Stellaceae bacterium]